MTNSRIGRKKGNIGRRASREAGNSPESIIINKLDVFTTPDRGKKDIPGWKTAIQSAESPIPQRSRLYDLYHDVELHPQVEAVTEKIYDSVASADWVFVDKDGAPVDAINELIDSLGFEDLLTEIVRSKFWHYTMVECRFKKDSDDLWELFTFEIPKKHMRPHLGVAAFSGVGDEGIDIRSKLYPSKILEVGKEKDLGKFAKIAPYVLLANGGIGDFAMVVQNFGEPIIDAVWDGMDENARQLLISSIKSRGPGGAIVRPTGTELSMLELVNCTGELQKTFIDICLKLISKGLLGTTETTDSSTSSGYAQAQTHQDQDEKKYARFIRFVRRVLNSRFKKILKANGFDTKGGKFIIKGEAEKIPLKDLIDILSKLHKEFKLPVDDDFLYEKFGITKPEQYEELKAELLNRGVDPNPVPDPNNPKPVPAPNDDPDDDPEDDPEDEPTPDPDDPEDEPKPKKANLSWRDQAIKLFEGFFDSAPAPDGACCTHHIALSDTQSQEQTQASAELIQEVYDSQGKLKVSLPMLESTSDLLLEGFRQGLSSAPRADRVELIDSGFDYGVDDPAIMTAYELNMFRFSAAKNLAQVQELNYLFRRSNNFREFEELAQATIDNYNRRWMLTEFNTGVNTGEARATYERLLTKTDLFPYWKYVTIGDDKVRHEHALLDELILPWDDTRWAKLFPPNGWNCRCYIVPVMAHELPEGYSLEKAQARADKYFKSKEFKRQSAQGWGVNRAAIGEVFTANQQYLYKQPGKSSKALNKLQSSDYELPSYSNLKAQASEALPEYSGTAAAFFGDLETIDDHSILRDLRKRQIRVPGQTAEATASDPDKTRKLQALQESLTNPDEIWINGSANSKIDQYVYIRYYSDEALITVATLDKLELNITDWFTLSDKKLGDYRRGILIKNNTTNVGK